MSSPLELPSPLGKGDSTRTPSLKYDPSTKILTLNGSNIQVGSSVSYSDGILTVNGHRITLLSATGLDDGVYNLSVTSGVPSWVAGSTPDPLLTNLHLWLRNDGADHSGNGNDLDTVGTPTKTTGIGGIANAAMRTDVNNYFGGNKIFDGDVPPVDLSVSCWFNRETGSLPSSRGYEFFYFADDDDGGWHGAGVGTSGGDGDTFTNARISGVYFGSDQSSRSPIPPDIILINTWHHYVATVHDNGNNSGTVKIYFDGALIQTVVNVPSNGSYPYQYNTGPRDQLGVSKPYQFLGVWDRLLTADDVTALYAAGAGHDPTA